MNKMFEHSAIPPELWRRLDALDASVARLAVFDADGTLWRGDLAEAHLEYVGEAGILPAPEGHATPFAAYVAACAHDVDQGYRLGVKLMARLEEAVLVATCEDAWRAHTPNVHQPVIAALRALEARGYSTWIVSASHRWAIEAAARSLKLSPNRIVTGDLTVEDGRLTDVLREPYPNGPGKVAAIQAHITTHRPAIAFGNSVHDAPMLDHAHIGVLIADRTQPLPTPLADHARTSDWIVWTP